MLKYKLSKFCLSSYLSCQFPIINLKWNFIETKVSKFKWLLTYSHNPWVDNEISNPLKGILQALRKVQNIGGGGGGNPLFWLISTRFSKFSSSLKAVDRANYWGSSCPPCPPVPPALFYDYTYTYLKYIHLKTFHPPNLLDYRFIRYLGIPQLFWLVLAHSATQGKEIKSHSMHLRSS